MTNVTRLRRPTENRGPSNASPDSRWKEGRMYAIAFDLDTEAGNRLHPSGDYHNAYGDIRRFLETRDFWNQQGSVYYSNHTKVVIVMKVVLDLQTRYPWFRSIVRDLRVLRIEENDDLLPLLGQPELPFSQTGTE